MLEVVNTEIAFLEAAPAIYQKVFYLNDVNMTTFLKSMMVFVTHYDIRSGSLLPEGHISRKRPSAPGMGENVQMI